MHTQMNSWLTIPEKSDFSIYNIPFGIGSTDGKPFVCTRIGDQVIDLFRLASTGFFKGLIEDNSVFEQDSLNKFIALGKVVTKEVRLLIQETLCNDQSPLRNLPALFIPYQNVSMLLPVAIGDYTDF
jgi:fumarylacetoacetase